MNKMELNKKNNIQTTEKKEAPIEYNLDVNDKKPETIISKNEIIQIPKDKLSSRIWDIFEKVKAGGLLAYSENYLDPEDYVILKDKIRIIDSKEVFRDHPMKDDIDIEFKGRLKELESGYKDILNKQISDLELDDDRLYALYDWKLQDCDIFDKNIVKDIKDIKGDTVLKNFGGVSIVSKCEPDCWKR